MSYIIRQNPQRILTDNVVFTKRVQIPIINRKSSLHIRQKSSKDFDIPEPEPVHIDHLRVMTDPISEYDAVNKKYVDNQIEQLYIELEEKLENIILGNLKV